MWQEKILSLLQDWERDFTLRLCKGDIAQAGHQALCHILRNPHNERVPQALSIAPPEVVKEVMRY